MPATNRAHDIKQVPLSEIKPNPKNPNKHSKEQVDRLVKIIEYQGFRSPLIISNRSGLLTSGHGRLEAAKKMKLATVPVIYQDFDTEEQEYAALVSENAIASWAELDLDSIQTDLGELPGLDVDLLGFKDFARMDGNSDEPGCDEDEVPEVLDDPYVKRGDVWQLGEHRLVCGDATSNSDVDKLMNGEKADMVFTDPPYGMQLDTDYKGSFGDNGFRKVKLYKSVHGDDHEFDFLTSYALVESVPEHFWWGADYYCKNLPKNGSWFVWNKRTSDGLKRMYGNHFELCWSKQKHQREIVEVAWASAFGHNKTDDGPIKVHPTMKPVKLILWFLERFEGRNVIDLFGGSGSTLIACEKTKRRCRMMEIDPHYCTIIIERWNKYTGKQAVRLSQGLNVT